ncbi:ABC transporter ATP-binding protein [Eoetvoesiella caeni]|uniref:Amino acid/amide ABC transporter ATP-binding protein 1 (HAAT family) n=1 Tax=Eoetvoesiella caeni TaxID=645616 RepID=A0A366H2Z8_9BURK|nr:ABC transporter ATP-binding protein [Eoetvoesiella caeni]MCI2810566.1 ABC transporter ATP-binding protein [Eoetvoesiella caeni]NYT56649.1 ABC transporter ATP-binding protein [Eoetvoesiella caeni]RBP36187.1 amino acid/amide ABC transporter ATP-binding protein 1 (HAAT family) [Eoetvoesiella caeni]
MTQLLSVENVSKAFGQLKVTDKLSFQLAQGEALGILGPNGAGKTTLFNLISGDIKADSGRISLKGIDITHQPAHRRCRQGIGRSYQIALPFGGMTVFENLLVAASFGAGRSGTSANDICMAILAQTGLLDKANRLAGTLTLLDRKRLELARALATQPQVLLLDEIAGGLTEQEALQLIEMVNGIRRQGVSIIWIEHVVHALMAVATRLMVIDFGRKLADGDPQAVMNSPDVKRVYMGIEA